MIIDLEPNKDIEIAIMILKTTAACPGGSEKFYLEALNRVSHYLETLIAAPGE